jgi:hypothetical protein
MFAQNGCAARSLAGPSQMNALLRPSTSARQKVRLGRPMTFGNMRQNGVRNLIGYCLNDSCRHQALIDVSKCPGDGSSSPLGPSHAFGCWRVIDSAQGTKRAYAAPIGWADPVPSCCDSGQA